jgi:hypothetical protein
MREVTIFMHLIPALFARKLPHENALAHRCLVGHLLEFQPVHEPTASKYRTISFMPRAQMALSVFVRTGAHRPGPPCVPSFAWARARRRGHFVRNRVRSPCSVIPDEMAQDQPLTLPCNCKSPPGWWSSIRISGFFCMDPSPSACRLQVAG